MINVDGINEMRSQKLHEQVVSIYYLLTKPLLQGT